MYNVGSTCNHLISKLEWYTDPTIYVFLFYSTAGGSWSYIGTDASRIPLESFSMNLGFVDQSTVMHEFGHALGLIHEHQSPFEGGFEWNKEEV